MDIFQLEQNALFWYLMWNMSRCKWTDNSKVKCYIFQYELNFQNIDTALRMLHQSEDLEARSLSIQCLLKIDRVDLALKEIKKMQEADEDATDATVTQLALAWVSMAVVRSASLLSRNIAYQK